MSTTHEAPQTDDGRIADVFHDGNGQLMARVEFLLPHRFREVIETHLQHTRFAARSRIARLGIDVDPKSDIAVEGDRAHLTVAIRSSVKSYGLGRLLERVFLPELPIGRLVVCSPDNRLSSDDVFTAYREHAFQLPKAFSIDSDGRLHIKPHRLVYRLQRQLTEGDLFAMIMREDGKEILNRLQIAERVDHVELEPGDGVITSCTMFLHRHYVVLDSAPAGLGQHMNAVLLDPISTRGTRVFLEFINDTPDRIVNPSATGFIYTAHSTSPPFANSSGMACSVNELPSVARVEYGHITRVFATQGEAEVELGYFDRPVGVMTNGGWDAIARKDAHADWTRPRLSRHSALTLKATRGAGEFTDSDMVSYGTAALDSLPAGARATVLLRYFPNLQEHVDITKAAAIGKVSKIVFQKASFEHGPFLSARDHARLADYRDFGIDVYWCNDHRAQLVVHRYRGRRGFFCELDKVDQFDTALLVSVYGSTKELPDPEEAKLKALLQALRRFFGPDLAIITGGGMGAMKQATDIGDSLDLLVGASYLEIEDQKTNPSADFYQVFQDNCRHSRQRWFEIASFQIFCLGGLGTLEEVGMTLTDVKLGVIDKAPLVLFGQSTSSNLYWEALGRQLNVMSLEGRGPDWLRSQVLVTDDPDEVVAFYSRVLELG